ncbi:hypothetical protein [Algoriphagus boritolerans]|uniref:hypothetical protein n=1 Tax=Algoriphagus boritolerans TaxID=308111 RepID=UPI000AE3D5CF
MEEPILEKKKEKDKTERERQTFYRVTFKNNCNLLQIADNKANIIISINALVISSTIAILGYGSMSQLIEINSPFTIVPIVLFLAVILTSTMLAVQAAKLQSSAKQKMGRIRQNQALCFLVKAPDLPWMTTWKRHAKCLQLKIQSRTTCPFLFIIREKY